MRKPRVPGAIGSDAIVGVVGCAVIVLVLALAYSGTLKGLFSAHPDRVVQAQFADSKQLAAGDEVRIDGVRVGEVEKISHDGAARAATVEMKIFDDAGPLYEDASAAARFGSLLGGRFYVDLERGTRGSGSLATVIPKRRTWSQVEVDDITSIGRGGSADGLRALPAAVGRALRDPAPVAGSLETLSDVAPVVARGVGAARGLDPARDIATLVRQTDATVAALDAPDDGLRSVVSGTASLVETTAARRADLRALLQRAPVTLQLANATLDDLDGTLHGLDPLVRKLQPSADDVAPTVQRLRPLVRGADALLARAEPLVSKLRPAVTRLGAAAHDGLPLLRTLRPSLNRLERSILPWLGTKDPQTGLTVAEAVGPGIYGLSGIAGMEDAQGHVVRFPATSGNSPQYVLPCQAYFGNPDKDKLVECNNLADDIKTYLSYDPLGPTPGSSDPPARARRHP